MAKAINKLAGTTISTSIAALAISANLVTADPTMAQPMSQLCNNPQLPSQPGIPCARDSNNKILGIPLGFYITREINNNWYTVVVTHQGPTKNYNLVYHSGLNCTGQAFMYDPGYLPQATQYDGHSFWTFDTRGGDGFTWLSYSTTTDTSPPGGDCKNWTNCVGDGKPCHADHGGPIIHLQDAVFTPPFTVH